VADDQVVDAGGVPAALDVPVGGQPRGGQQGTVLDEGDEQGPAALAAAPGDGLASPAGYPARTAMNVVQS
jgi:hypothetical protein